MSVLFAYLMRLLGVFLALFNLSTHNDTHTHNDKHNIHNDTHLLTGTHTDVIITDKKKT